MVDRVYIILQARMGSQRLPGKILKKVKGIPLLKILLYRLKKANLPIIIATSDAPENDILEDLAKNTAISVFRGSEDNVLSRYYHAALEANARVIIRLTGDNPLIDGEFLRSRVDEFCDHFNERNYFSLGRSKSFPLGMSFEIFSFTLLKEAFLNSTLPGEFEHVTPYMHQNRPGNINILQLTRSVNRYHYRLTVDTPDDFKLIKTLVEDYNCIDMSMEEIISILDKNPHLCTINESVIQKKWNE
jgi:spore coat polysaccharide biosynthesis protein SpsF